MTIIKVIYDDGNNTMVKVMREVHKNKKRLADMTNQEMMNTLMGLAR